jgi:hypothetical protein
VECTEEVSGLAMDNYDEKVGWGRPRGRIWIISSPLFLGFCPGNMKTVRDREDSTGNQCNEYIPISSLLELGIFGAAFVAALYRRSTRGVLKTNTAEHIVSAQLIPAGPLY